MYLHVHYLSRKDQARAALLADNLTTIYNRRVGLVVRVVQFPDISRLFTRLPAAQGVAQHTPLEIGLVGRAEAVTKQKAHGRDSARRPHLARGGWPQGDEHSWQTKHLDLTLNRNDRAMTEWSASGQQYGVGLRPLDDLRHLRRGAFVEIAQLLRVPHEAEVLIAHTADHALSRHLAQAVYREDTVDVLVGMRVVVVFMCHHELAALHIARDKSPGVVARQVIWFLVAQMHASRADQCERRLAEFVTTWGIRNTTARHRHAGVLPLVKLLMAYSIDFRDCAFVTDDSITTVYQKNRQTSRQQGNPLLVEYHFYARVKMVEIGSRVTH